MKSNILDNKEIANYGRKMKLNSLLFDPRALPEKIDIEHTHGKLVKLKTEQRYKENIIRNSVDLSISVFNLERQFNCSYETISKLDGLKNKEDLC